MGMESMSNTMTGGMTPAEAILVSDRDRNDGMFGGNGMWVFFLFFLLAWGGAGFGGFGGNAAQSALTRAELYDGLNYNQIESGIRNIQNGLCDGFYSQNTTMLQGFNDIQRDLCTGFSAVNAGIAENRFAAQQCCCETNRNIDAVRYENAKNTCDIMQNADKNTQRIIDMMTQNTIQSLRDELQSAQLALQNNAQTTTLINAIKPCPVPAYPSCSPYQAFSWGQVANGCGCGCGC